jgi:hypothetical protein
MLPIDRLPRLLRFLRRGTAFAALLLVSLAGARAQNETPGTGAKKNHTAYLYAPYRWAFGLFDVDRFTRNSLSARDDSGQQYDWVTLVETKKPTADAPAKICTLTAFRDLISKNADNMGVLVISSHGGKDSLSVEAFASEKARDDQYDAYIKAGFTKDLITKTENDQGSSISVTDKFIQKYRNVGQAIVFISACQGGTLADDFTDAKGLGQPAANLARVALGGNTDAKWAAYAEYGLRFFSALDGQPFPRKAEADRVKQRAVKAATDAANAVQGTATDPAFRVEFTLTGNGATTLAPVVQDDLTPCMSPIKAGDTITFTFDTNCDTTVVPKVLAAGGGVTLGAPVWMKGVSNVLTVPVTAPAVATNTFKITLQGDSVKAGKNTANLDGNSNPDKVNGRGPATGAKKSDDYVIEYQNGTRVH